MKFGAALASSLVLCLSESVAKAQIVIAELGFETGHYQSGTPSLQFPNIDGYVMTGTGDSAVTLTTPTNFSINLSSQGPGAWTGASNSGTVNGNYPYGTYLFTASGGTLGTSSVAVQATESFPAEQLFTGNSLLNLEMESVTSPISISFSQFVPDPAATSSYLFLAAYGSGQSSPFGGGLVASATGYTIPANTFAPGTTYDMTIQATNVYQGVGSVSTSVEYTTNTLLQFTTAAPEPSGYGYILITLLAAGFVRYRARRA